MENKPTQLKVAMKYGAIYGFSSIAVSMVCYLLGLDMQSKLPQYISYLFLILFIFLGIKNFRDEGLDGFITYGKSLGTGTLIAMCGGIITGIFALLFFQYIAPEMGPKIIEDMQKKMSEAGNTEEQIEMAVNMATKFMTPFWLFAFSVLGSALLGFIFSLIISVFTKKEQNPFSSNIG